MTDAENFPVQFGTVAIVGVGLIGGSLGLALRRRRLAHRVLGIGRDVERMRKAVALGAIAEFTTDLAGGVAEAEVVFLCTTVRHIARTLPDVLAAARPDAIISDVGSTKGAIVAAAGGDPRFVGGHPMAGSERTGVEAATPLLFQEATWALTPSGQTDPHALGRVRALAQEVGAATLVLAPDAHDAMVAVTSHLPHVIAAAFMRQAAAAQRTAPQTPRLAAGSFADMTRIAESSPELWRDVCLTNRDAILMALRAFRAELDVLEGALTEDDSAALEAFFEGGASAKRNWGAL